METKRAEARAKRQKMMLEDPMMGVIPRVAIPMIISSMIDSIYNLADTFFVSQLGMNATAAVAINDSLMNILRAISMGFAMGAASYISRLMGAKMDKKASKVGSTVLILGSLFSLCFGLICLGFAAPSWICWAPPPPPRHIPWITPSGSCWPPPLPRPT